MKLQDGPSKRLKKKKDKTLAELTKKKRRKD
jgi:hypothetical protein